MLEVDGGVGVDEPERDALRQTGIHRCVVLMTEPLESCEDGGRILPGAEGGIVVIEAVLALKLQDLIVQTRHFVVQRVAGLVAAAPEIGHAPHVGVAAVIDGRGKPLLVGLRVVVDLLGDVFGRVSLTVSVEIVVLLDPIVQGQFHRHADLVVDENTNGLLIGRGFVRLFRGRNEGALGRSTVNTEGARPVGIWCQHVRRVLFVVGLHLVGDAFRDVQVWHVDADEEGPVVVRRVPCGRFDVIVASDANVESAVERRVLGVLEPHRTGEMQLLAGGDPALVWNVVTGQLTVVVPDLEVTKAVRAVGEKLAVGLQQRRAVSRRTGVVEAIRSETDAADDLLPVKLTHVRHLVGHGEQPVHFEDAVVEHRVGRRVELDVILRIVGCGEDVAWVPGEGWVR